MVVAYPETGAMKWLQVGVITRAARIGGTHISTVTAKVASYAEWIRTTTNGAVSIIIAAPDPDDPEEITTRISEIKAQILTMQATVQSLQGNRTLLKQRIDEFRGMEGQDRKLQTTEDGILGSVSAILPQ